MFLEIGEREESLWGEVCGRLKVMVNSNGRSAVVYWSWNLLRRSSDATPVLNWYWTGVTNIYELVCYDFVRILAFLPLLTIISKISLLIPNLNVSGQI